MDTEFTSYLIKRLDKQDDMLTRIEVRQDNQDSIIHEIKVVISEHTAKEEQLHPHIIEMAQMWQHSKAVAWFITKMSAFAASIAAAWVWLKDHIK